MKLLFGCEPKTFLRDWMLYVSVQLLIFIKTVWFIFWFGHGISYFGQPVLLNLPFVAVPVFGSPIHVFDYIFHQLMHGLIAFWVFLLAKHVQKIKWKELVALFFVATVLHNVGYWLTRAHPSWAFSFHDFWFDFFALWVFFFIFYAAIRLVPQSKKWEIPYFG